MASPIATRDLKPTAGMAPLRGWVALGAVVAVALVQLSPAVGLAPGALSGDLGIQYFLGGQTADGAIPLIDFEHTWNVGSWYFNALLNLVAADDPSAWLYLWGRVLGPALAAVTAVGVMYRLRWRAEWLLIGAGSWLALSYVIHSKYTIPVVWVFVLLPTPRSLPGLRRQILVRALLAGVTLWSQVELAVLLGAGVMLYDLIGAPVFARQADPWRDRILRAGAVPLGIALALGLELGVYALLGQPPGEILRQLFGNAAETADGFTYGYPLFSAVSLRPKLFPASILVAFVPALWLRLQPATRLTACLHLSQALIAIRRPDPAHVDAATTLLGLLVVMVAHDLLRDRTAGVVPSTRRRIRTPEPRQVGLAVIGAAVTALAVGAAFLVPSLLALAVPTLLLAGLATLGSHSSDRGPLSMGAGAVVVVLLLSSVTTGVVSSIRSGDAMAATRTAAVELSGPLDRCTGSQRVAWVVPEPLSLYTEMGITNPTPYNVFWYGFAAEQDRIRQMFEGGQIPAIVQVGTGWPDSFGTLPDDIERQFDVCDRVSSTSIASEVTIWVRR